MRMGVSEMNSTRELKGWILSIVGVLGLMVLAMDAVEEFIPSLFVQVLRWLVWIVIVVGVLEAMQFIRIFNYDERKK